MKICKKDLKDQHGYAEFFVDEKGLAAVSFLRPWNVHGYCFPETQTRGGMKKFFVKKKTKSLEAVLKKKMGEAGFRKFRKSATDFISTGNMWMLPYERNMF